MLELNATFIGQIIVFLLLLWFIYKVRRADDRQARQRALQAHRRRSGGR